MMTIEEMLTRLAAIDNVAVLLAKHVPCASPNRQWWCRLEYANPGVELKFEGHGPAPREALSEAFLRLTQVAELGLGRGWDVPALEYKADEAEASLRDSDIPF